MDLFNKTFFRFAFGFLGIIALSVLAIFAANMLMGGKKNGATICVTNCLGR